MRASPGSRVEPAPADAARARRPCGARTRRTAASRAPVASVALRARAAAAPPPDRTGPHRLGVEGPEALWLAAASTWSVSRVKLARERARGPLAVWIDSRISKRPLGRATT